jgi:surface polysaccharide O-acyltransferase-like enzyme
MLYLSGAFRWDFRGFATPRMVVAYAAWDALAFVGFSLALLAIYRRRFDRQGAFAKFMSDNAFAVFVFHAPILVALSRAQQGWDAPPVLKAITLTALATAASFAIAPALRRIPLLKRIL